MNDRPFVSLDPSMQSGSPCVNGTRMTVAALVSFVWIGKADDISTAYPGYGIAETQVACWYAAIYGKRKYRKVWSEWAEMDEGALYAMCDDEVNWSVEAHIADPSELKAYADEFGYLQDLEPKAEP